VFQRYYRYIETQLEDVTAKLATFG